MQLIVITPPEFLPAEGETIATLLHHGIWRVHLRKPHASAEEMARLIEGIAEQWRDRLVIHDHFELATRYSLKGIHLNGRNPDAPQDYRGSRSCSTHSTDELAERLPTVDYAFLSPIFDSISKKGYRAAFTERELQAARQKGLIGPKVFALGGVSAERLATLKTYGFGGAALLGDVWEKAGTKGFAAYVDHIVETAELL